KTPPPAARPSSQSSTASAAIAQQYQAAVQLVQQGKFDKAIAAFEKVQPAAPPEIRERCRMYINTCRKQLDNKGLAFGTPEERYDYAVSQINAGDFEEATNQLKGILADDPRADFAYYGLALLFAITGKTQDCLDSLSQAIELNPKNKEAYKMRAETKFELGSFNDAVSDCSEAIKIDINYGAAYLLRGVSKSFINDKSGACKDINKAADLNTPNAAEMYEQMCK
ncbi:MAG: tetratricopeptide repeat protein, partial [Bacteroidota bacterium]|nr:tetratricopeptide repeat protein [Bacteroidota bacterium]